MTDLWADQRLENRQAAQPLAVRMRPRSLDQIVGQHHVVGDGCLLRRMLDADRLTSVILWGPPGTGKTTLAEVIANESDRHFERANAALIGVKDIRTILNDARTRLEHHRQRTILFLDEIHRFTRSQQDVLLADVEHGVITLIGATTENPAFTVNSALTSRSTLFQLEPLIEDEILEVIRMASTDERGLAHLDLHLDDDALAHWARISDGDARRALNALEIAALSATPDDAGRRHIDLHAAEQSIQAKALVYDGTGDEHYDVISAYIKSMRGSDPDAAVYWLARMLEAGEDPRFIARRLSILAAEDIGNADPNALVVAEAAWSLTERIGIPECQLPLSQATIYMAMAPKSNASARAIWDAREDVRTQRTIPVPRALRDSHYAASKDLGHGVGYISPHSDAARGDSEENSASIGADATKMEYLGVDRTFYRPTDRGFEAELLKKLTELKPKSRSSDEKC